MANKAPVLDDNNAKALHEIINLVGHNVYLQIQGIEVAKPYICGAPGGGKTASLKWYAKQNNWGIVSTHFALKPLEETGGIPQFTEMVIDHKTNKKELATIWSFPDIMRKLYETSNNFKDVPVIWFLDDMHLASSVHNAIMYELLTERKLREYKLPDNVAIVLAGNHASNKAGAKTMFSAIANRVQFMPVYTDFDGWKKNFAFINNIHPSIISFLGNSQFNQFFHECEQVDTPWGSPRSWTFLSNFLSYWENIQKGKKMDAATLLYVAGGLISKTATSEFTNYYNIFADFDMKKIIEDVEKGNECVLPDDAVKRYAFAYSLLVYYTKFKNPNKIIKPFSEIVYKFLKEHSDLGIVIINEILEIEKTFNRQNLCVEVLQELNKIEPGITQDLIKEISNV